MKFRSFIEAQLSEGFDEFVTLYFPGPQKPWEYQSELERLKASWRDQRDEKARESRLRRLSLARDCQERWLSAIRRRAAVRFRYLLILEDRISKRDFLFHILLGGCGWRPWDFNDYWKPLWKQMSGGTAFTRRLDERIAGLVWYFVMTKGCVLETDSGERFCKTMFEP